MGRKDLLERFRCFKVKLKTVEYKHIVNGAITSLVFVLGFQALQQIVANVIFKVFRIPFYLVNDFLAKSV